MPSSVGDPLGDFDYTPCVGEEKKVGFGKTTWNHWRNIKNNKNDKCFSWVCLSSANFSVKDSNKFQVMLISNTRSFNYWLKIICTTWFFSINLNTDNVESDFNDSSCIQKFVKEKLFTVALFHGLKIRDTDRNQMVGDIKYLTFPSNDKLKWKYLSMNL